MLPSNRGLAAAVLALAAGAASLLQGAEAAEAAGRAGSMAETIMQYFKTAGWAVLSFAAVLFILWKKAFPPIVEALDKRARLIQESLDAARRAKEEAEAMMARHEESLEKARGEARAIIEEGKADALRVKGNIIESARKEAGDIAARAKRDIVLAKQAAVDELYRQAARLSFELAEKVIQKSLRPEDHQGLISDCIQKYKGEARAR
ncbi:MAG: F0F1 ATP synthase subunit B [Planctomycetes bacterium]|nr:F0F1 ATP synthase subunit B [Planctomycetota bacterium]